MSAKNILLIIPELIMGGAQRSISKLSLEFARHHNVWLVVFNKMEVIAYPYGGELVSLDVVPGDGVVNKFAAFWKRVIRLRKIKKDLAIDVSISFLEGADYVNVLSRSTEKVVLSIRGSKKYDETIKGRFSLLRNKILIPWLYKKADTIITVNHGIANELKIYYGLKKARIITIGNYYSIGEILTSSLEDKPGNLEELYQDPVLITTGRLAPEKGLKNLIYVFFELKKMYKNLRLVIVGDGPEYHDLLHTVKELGLTVTASVFFNERPDVAFLGNQSNVFKFLKGARLYMMNSSSEGFPNGLAEAMICRLPVVSSDCPYGPREILAKDYSFSTELRKPFLTPNGLLMPAITKKEDIPTWVETLGNILGKDDVLLQLAHNGFERINDFDKETIITKWYRALDI